MVHCKVSAVLAASSDSVELDNFGTAELPGWEQVDAVLFYKRKHWT